MNENNQAQPNIKDIQNQIAKRFGFDNLSDEKQQSLIQDMTESVIKRALINSYEKLSEEDRITFDNLSESQDIEGLEKIDNFLMEKLPDYGQIIEKAISDLEQHIKESMNK